MSEQTARMEEIKVKGNQLFEKIKEIVRAGNVRRLLIKNRDGRTFMDIPLTAGVVGAVLAPQVALLGAIVTLFIDGSIVVVKMTAADAPPNDQEIDEQEIDDRAIKDMFEI